MIRTNTYRAVFRRENRRGSRIISRDTLKPKIAGSCSQKNRKTIMAAMTPDYEIDDDVMYASDQRSVGIPAKVKALTAPNGNQNYLQIRTAEGVQLSDYRYKMRPLKPGMPCIHSNNMSKEAYIKSIDVAHSKCDVEYASVNGLDTQYEVDLNYIYGRPKKADGSSCIFGAES